MRRLAAATLVVAAACGGAAAGRDRDHLVLWETYAPEERKVFVEIVRDFERWMAEAHGRRVRIEVQPVPFDGHIDKIKYAAITHTAPDIARVDGIAFIDLVYGQAVLDLLEIDTGVEDFLATFLPPARDRVRIPLRRPDGAVRTGVFGIPDQITGVAVYYNKEIFRRAGLPPPPASIEELSAARAAGRPWDWERFREYARATTDRPAGRYGVGLYSSLWFTFPFLNAYGAEFISIDADGTYRAVIDADSAVAAFTTMASLYWDGFEAGAWRQGALTPDAGFANGKYAMIFSGPWNLKAFPNVEFGIALFPEGPAMRDVVKGGRTYRVGTSTNVGGTNMVVLRSCRDPELAYAFLRYLTSPEVHARWCEALGQIQVNAAAEAEIDLSRNPEMRVFIDQMRTAVPAPKIPRFGVLDGQVMAPEIERIFRGGSVAEVRAALSAAVRGIEERILAEVNAR